MYRFIDHTLKPNFELEKVYNQELKNRDDDNRSILVLRPTWFFCETQVITLGKLREYFTDYAIVKLLGDGFVKFRDND